MIKKIQKYLLLNYPLIWNLKIIPILLTAIVGNILTFVFGYLTTSINFNLSNFYSENNFVSIAAIYILAILILILWLVAVSKNNAFKNYYPSSVVSLYLQWILIGVSVFSILLMPFCYDRGINLKERSYITKQDLIKEAEVINMVKILLPTPYNYREFYQEVPTEVYQNNNYSSKEKEYDYSRQNNRDSLFFNNQLSNIYYEDYPNFSQYSLLNYEVDEYGYRPLENTIKSLNNNRTYIKDELTVKDWLMTEKSDSIKNLMTAFIDIQNKYNVSCNLTADKWFKLIYKPSKFEINKNSLITDYFQENYEYGSSEINTKYYVTFSRLSSNFEQIADAYNSTGFTYFLSVVYAALCLTMLIFAFRVTSGKDWLIALVSMGIFSLIVWIIVFGLSILFKKNAFYLAPLIYILLFVVEALLVSNKKHRGNSGVLVNHIIGLLPIIPLLILLFVYMLVDSDTKDTIDNNIRLYCSENLILTLFTMPFMIILIIKWKGIPEK